MTDALIFFRTQATAKSVPAFQDPNNLPSAQKLEFTFPEDILSSISLMHENNIKDAPVSNPDGVRKVNRQDNGLNQWQLTFRGRFKDTSVDLIKLQEFARRLQVENDFHQFGIFGFSASFQELPSSPISVPFNINPTQEFGLAIKRLTIGRAGEKPKSFDFEVVMALAGVLPQTVIGQQ